MIKTKISAGFCKVISEDFTPLTSYKLCMAKNESESCTISMVPTETVKLRLGTGDVPEGFTVELEREHTIEIDGLVIEDQTLEVSDAPYTVLPIYDRERKPGKLSPYAPTRRLILSGITTRSGAAVEVTDAPDLYPSLEVTLK